MLERATTLHRRCCHRHPIPVNTVDPAGKAPSAYSWMQTRLMGQYIGKRPFGLVYVSKPLITATVVTFANLQCVLVPVHSKSS